MYETLRFTDVVSDRPQPGGIDLRCNMEHFALITYSVDPQRAIELIPRGYQPDTVIIDGQQRALLSVVPFIAVNFTSAVVPFPKFRMGHTDYRLYIKNKTTGKRCVWVLGTTLDSWTRLIPCHFWQLRWYRGEVQLECDFDQQSQLYRNYQLKVKSNWAPATAHLTQSRAQVIDLPGFPDSETGLVYLSHALTGIYLRRDGKLGCCDVWHRPLQFKAASLQQANFGLLAELNLVDISAQQQPHSVLLARHTPEFTIYLPPKLLE